MILLKIASAITSPFELSKLGIWLGCEPEDVRRLKVSNRNLKDAAYKILFDFYYSVPDSNRWRSLIRTLRELNKNTVVKELELNKLHQKAQRSGSVRSFFAGEFQNVNLISQQIVAVMAELFLFLVIFRIQLEAQNVQV